jgi:hypothetical protein
MPRCCTKPGCQIAPEVAHEHPTLPVQLRAYWAEGGRELDRVEVKEAEGLAVLESLDLPRGEVLLRHPSKGGLLRLIVVVATTKGAVP